MYFGRARRILWICIDEKIEEEVGDIEANGFGLDEKLGKE